LGIRFLPGWITLSACITWRESPALEIVHCKQPRWLTI
jgi:hypothetical protein